MSDMLMPEVHEALRRAVAARGRVRRPRRRRLGLLAVGAVVVSGSAVATTGVWQPTLGNPDHGAQPRAAGVGVPAEQLALLGVLRRPQTAADRGPLVRAALRSLDRGTINGIHVDAIRVLFHTPREIAVLIPAERFGPRGHTTRHGLCLMSSSYATARDIPITQHGKPATWHVPAGFNGWGMHCGTTEDLRTTGLEVSTTPDDSGGLMTSERDAHTIPLRHVTLVPDAVASARIRLRGNRHTTARVHDNTYRYTSIGLNPFWGAAWFDASGRKIDHRRRTP
jgi:hypothetical protein